MSKRYYITRVLGTGEPGIDPWYSELRVYIQEHWPDEPHFIKQAIHPDALMWAVMKYDLSQTAHDDVMANLTGTYSFPETGLNRTMAEIPTAKRTAMRTKLENIGFRFDWATSITTLRAVLKYLVRSLQIASWAGVSISTINHFDFDTTVAEIPVNARDRIAEKLTNLNVPTAWITGTTTIKQIADKIQRHDGGEKRLFGTVRRAQWLFQDEETY